ncbi:FUSC family protein [Gordonia tangerina]|uniref:FUSC family protein n=1 Tax=Gordonia tangerina TaxID=2911060 RepID=A0ABS9DTE0_9ACTN|nr:FUSC family protein [Gordonia tangerina]MCF3941088.1 FUSC family protein [Gordonia tangerina]
MRSRTPVTADVSRAHPAAWIREMVRLKPATMPVGHMIRSGIVVGGPFIVGVLIDDVLTGMWIALAGLLLAAGERAGTYRLNFAIILISTPIAATGYVLGFLQHIPWAAMILVMVALALGCGLIAGLGPAFSVAGMQFLVIASIAIGVSSISNWWIPLALYFVGGIIYAALLAVEMVITPRRPQRLALQEMLHSLAGLAHARSADLRDGGDRCGAAREACQSARRTAVTRIAELTIPGIDSSRTWRLTSAAIFDAERVEALLIGERSVSAVDAVARQLDALTTVVSAEKDATSTTATEGATSIPGGPPPHPSPLEQSMTELAEAVRHGHDGRMVRHPVTVPAIGGEVVAAAGRLALCFGIAVAAKLYFPSTHWFWVPLTVCLVMKPDFGSVFSRAILRVLGTIAGAAVASIIIVVVPKGVGIGIAIGVLAAAVPYLMLRSYALQAVAITPVVILLIDLISPGTESVNDAWQRIAATVLGGAIVLVFGYLIWPHSRQAWVAATFATATERIAAFLTTAATPIPDDARAASERHTALVSARRTAYRALSDLDIRMQRALSEPPPAETVARAWIPAIAATSRLADAVSAYADDRVNADAPPNPAGAGVVAAVILQLGRGDSPDPVEVTDDRLSAVAAGVNTLRATLHHDGDRDGEESR